MGKNKTHEALKQSKRSGGGGGGEDAGLHLGVDASFHTAAWHEARLAALEVERPTYEDWRKKQKEEALKEQMELDAQAKAMDEYKKALEHDRARRLGGGEEKTRKVRNEIRYVQIIIPKLLIFFLSIQRKKDAKKKKKNKRKRKHRHQSTDDDDSSGTSSSDTSSSESEEGRRLKRRDKKDKKKKRKRRRRRRRSSSSSSGTGSSSDSSGSSDDDDNDGNTGTDTGGKGPVKLSSYLYG